MADLTPGELKYLVARQREEIKTINDVSRLLRATTDPSETVRRVASYLKQTFPLALCGIFIADQRLLYQVRFAPIASMEMKRSTQQILQDVREKLGLEVREDQVAILYDDQLGAAAQTVGTLGARVSIPLKVEQGVLGLLSLFGGQAAGLTTEDMHTIEIVADQLRAAMSNALLVNRLKEADRLKNELLSVISHELRIPLTVIHEGVNLVQEGALGAVTSEQREFLGTVTQNVDRLRFLLDKVLSATHAISGNLKARLAPTELAALFDEAAAAAAAPAQAKQVALALEKPAEAVSASVDRALLRQALGYLIENGIQATPAGGRISVRWGRSPDGRVEIRVSDTGIGIAEKELPGLFEKFRSIGGINERKTGGLGLGLFLVKAIVDAHGGEVGAQSAPGKGTTITMKLPVGTPSAGPAPSHP